MGKGSLDNGQTLKTHIGRKRFIFFIKLGCPNIFLGKISGGPVIVYLKYVRKTIFAVMSNFELKNFLVSNSYLLFTV